MRSSALATSLLQMLRKSDVWGAECRVWAPFPFPPTGARHAVWTTVFSQRLTNPVQCKYKFYDFLPFNPLCLRIPWNISISSLDAPCGQSYKGAVGNYALHQLAQSNLVVRSDRGASVGVSYMELFYGCKYMKNLGKLVRRRATS